MALNSVSSAIHSSHRGSLAWRVKYRRVLMSSRDCLRKSSSSILNGRSDVTYPLILRLSPQRTKIRDLRPRCETVAQGSMRS